MQKIIYLVKLEMQLKIVMMNLGATLTNEEATQMIIAADADGDGLVSSDEFVKIMIASSS